MKNREEQEETEIIEIEDILDKTNSSMTETNSNGGTTTTQSTIFVKKRVPYEPKNIPNSDIDDLLEKWPMFNIEKVSHS